MRQEIQELMKELADRMSAIQDEHTVSVAINE
jgi:hypothetical protein